MSEVKWKNKPEDHDYPAAESYLTLVFGVDKARSIVERLQKQDIVKFKAKDILRASGYSLLPVSNTAVQKDLAKIKNGTELSPVLLVNDGHRVHIADGFHRVTALYYHDENSTVIGKFVQI